MMAQQIFRRWHWLTWLVGSIVLWALIYQNMIGFAPIWLRSLTVPTRRGGYSIGWPLIFLWNSIDDPDRGFALPRLVMDLFFCGFIFGGTVAAVEPFARATIAQPTASRRTLAVIITTILGWLLLISFLRVPVFFFLGWASLSVIYLAMPCVAFSVVATVARTRSFRFSIKTMLLALTVVCLGAAWVAWPLSRERLERQARAVDVRVANETVNYGTMEPDNTMSNGRVVAWDYKLVKRTEDIPCTLGTIFGIEYKLVAQSVSGKGPVPGAVRITKVWRYPRELINPRTGKAELQTELSEPIPVGERDVMAYRLGYEHLLVPGEWKFEVWYDDPYWVSGRRKKLLLEQVFVLRKE